MKIEEVVGQRIRAAREAKGLSQASVGLQLQEPLGKPWPGQQIYLAEVGKRRLAAAEILAFSTVLQIPIGRMFTPDDLNEPIEFPSGMEADAVALAIARMDKDDLAVITSVVAL